MPINKVTLPSCKLHGYTEQAMAHAEANLVQTPGGTARLSNVDSAGTDLSQAMPIRRPLAILADA